MRVVIRNWKDFQAIGVTKPSGERAIIYHGGTNIRRAHGVKLRDDGKLELIQNTLEPNTVVKPSWFPADWPWHHIGR